MNVQLPKQAQQNSRALHKPDRSTPLRRYLVGGVALIAAFGGAYWYFNHGGSGPQIGPRFASAPVQVAIAVRRDMPVIEHTIGTVVANSTVSVTALVQGQLIGAYFKEGQMVKTGDLLFQIDPSTYQAAYDAALATLASAKTNADRSAALLKQNAIAAQTDDNNQAAYRLAKANAEAARLNLQFTQIRSPIDGKTGPILLQPGNLVSVNGITAPLVNIAQIQPIKVSFSLPQSDLPRIQARQRVNGLKATIALQDEGGKNYLVPVDFIGNNVNNTNGTIELRATLDNADKALVPGELVDVVIELNNIPGATVVPRMAINSDPDGDFVYVVTADNRAVQRNVKVLFDDGVNDAIQGGVRPGEKVITDGQLRVVPGAAVIIQGGTSNHAPKPGGPDNGKRPGAAGAAASRVSR